MGFCGCELQGYFGRAFGELSEFVATFECGMRTLEYA